jgi:hypothetical protein
VFQIGFPTSMNSSRFVLIAYLFFSCRELILGFVEIQKIATRWVPPVSDIVGRCWHLIGRAGRCCTVVVLPRLKAMVPTGSVQNATAVGCRPSSHCPSLRVGRCQVNVAPLPITRANASLPRASLPTPPSMTSRASGERPSQRMPARPHSTSSRPNAVGCRAPGALGCERIWPMRRIRSLILFIFKKNQFKLQKII